MVGMVCINTGGYRAYRARHKGGKGNHSPRIIYAGEA
nr:MAG TPA: hypothetical protein [Caudoviricetes sp.]